MLFWEVYSLTLVTLLIILTLSHLFFLWKLSDGPLLKGQRGGSFSYRLCSGLSVRHHCSDYSGGYLATSLLDCEPTEYGSWVCLSHSVTLEPYTGPGSQ